MNTIQIVESILSKYKDYTLDYDEALLQIMKLQKQKSLHQKGEIEKDIDVITGMSLNSPVLSHIPRSVTNKFSSVTENVALNYLQFIQPSKLQIKELESKINEQKVILTNCYEKINMIEKMFSLLNEQEKYIIESIYINGYSLNRTWDMFNKEYPDFYIATYKIIRTKKFKALKKMAKRIKAP